MCSALDIESTAGQVLDGVASLLDKSLLQQTEVGGDEPRLLMLETLREYGLECLVASEEMETARSGDLWKLWNSDRTTDLSSVI